MANKKPKSNYYLRATTLDVAGKTPRYFYVYLAKEIKSGIHKIGITEKLSVRMDAYKYNSSMDMRVLFCIRTKLTPKNFEGESICRQIEQDICQVYNQKLAYRKEWFNLSESDVSNIKWAFINLTSQKPRFVFMPNPLSTRA